MYLSQSILWSIDEDVSGVDLDIADYGFIIKLKCIYIPKSKRNQGLGTKIMFELIERADEQGKVIVLETWNKWGMTKNYLRNYYGKFGFVKRKMNRKRKTSWFIKGVDMYRMPRKSC